MNELTKEWVEKAEADYHSALREYRAMMRLDSMHNSLLKNI